ncbi:hypothetical protein BIY29_03830 [Brenneria alni]|uniref:Uncharacterized protein n=1 Tax=Brenneria alni TaxID=71656 RepID=A0A421DRZ7_9GAMM|nr:hypothetical protein BIY29_03830 [Brenneria alni]
MVSANQRAAIINIVNKGIVYPYPVARRGDRLCTSLSIFISFRLFPKAFFPGVNLALPPVHSFFYPSQLVEAIV